MIKQLNQTLIGCCQTGLLIVILAWFEMNLLIGVARDIKRAVILLLINRLTPLSYAFTVDRQGGERLS